ncbi:MAG: hypothetical protein RR500_03675 [Bacilli bacterium]
MNIEKKKLADIERCYCASNIEINGKNHPVFASEDPNVGCIMFSGKEFEHQEIIWKEAGGCMSIIPIPNTQGEFLAIQEFYLKVSPSHSKIVWGKYTENGFIVKDILCLPFIHRFDIYEKNGINYFIGATIATSKENKEDWSVPGRIYVGTLPKDLREGIEIEILIDGLYKNHGYWHDNEEECGYFGSNQGIIKVTPPKDKKDLWKSEKIMEGQISEIAVIDIDCDGEKEIMTIEPFHGSDIHIYKKINGVYQVVYTYSNEIEFAHALVGGYLRKIPTFIAGVRRKDAELFYVQYVDGKFITKVIENGVGPANLLIVNEKDHDIIIAANHTKNEAAIYIVKD